ncbi:hypothetical protein C2E23DRAFT_508120 [Lenzites betulinus]|nr:hypothetical protein C2E23DRAFT_508120 [Lenzites betulinus]
MSISTCSLNSHSGSSDIKRDSPVCQKGWASELQARVLQYPRHAPALIDELMPCSVPFPDTESEDALDKVFAEYSPQKGKELDGYNGLIKALNDLVASFPADRRPAIVDTHSTELAFPFGVLSDNHHHTFPDISVSFPGAPSASVTSWQGISMVMEVKGDETEDPFPRDGEKHVNTVIQLAKSARSLLLAHGFLAAFVVGVYGKTIRLARFDSSCALVAPPISLRAGEGGAGLLKRFLWHFVHPAVGDTVVGCDPTVTRLDADDQEWIKMQLDLINAKNRTAHLAEVDKGRRIEVYDQQTGKCIPYLLYHLVDANGRLFSRATTVWRAIEDTRVWKDGRLVPNPNCTTAIRPRIVKESWRQLVRTAETAFYERLAAKIKGQRTGIATMECGGDIGDFEFCWWEETSQRAPVEEIPNSDVAPEDTSPADGDYMLFSSTGSTGPYNKPFVTPDREYLPQHDYPLPYPQHQTYSWRMFGEEYWHRERSHMRIVIDDVGRPLTDFKSSREMVMAIRDGVRGHQQAWEEAHVLHRDVSLGNILINDELDDDALEHVGFIHDFDYSSMEPDDTDPAPSEDEAERTRKERTGTYFFMAVELISPNRYTLHQPHHDLESAYWVLLWTTLRHTDCCDRLSEKRGYELCKDIFQTNIPALKKCWLIEYDQLDVAHNAPLSGLLKTLKGLVRDNVQEPLLEAAHLTHKAVLKAFDDALAMPGWPEDDWIPCSLEGPKTRTDVVPILADIPPGYPRPLTEGRQLRSHSSQVSGSGQLVGTSALSSSRGQHQAVPPTASGSASLGTRPSTASGSKRTLDDIAKYSHPLDESRRPAKRSKTTMDPPPHPNNARRPNTRARGSRRGSGITLQPSRSSERVKARKEKSTSGGAPAA